ELAELRRLCDASCAKSDHLAGRLMELAGVLDALPKSCAGDCSELIAAIVAQAGVTDIRGAKHWNNVDDYEPFKQACERVRDVLKNCAISEPPDFSATR